MVLGFNHNVTYKGIVFHVQTEDSGVAIPHIITLLYRGGVILSSQKTSYADILKIDNLETVVEELMKEQHKCMMRRLKSGEFDERAFSFDAASTEIDYESSDATSTEIDYELSPLPSIALEETDLDTPLARETSQCVMVKASQPETGDSKLESAPDEPAADKDDAPMEFTSLDDAILAFFANNQK